MIEKDDWRLTGGEEQYVRNQIFQKIRFPEFWHESFKVKNHFYQKIIKDAQKFVKEHKRGEEYLEGEKVQAFWHEHCFFCWEKFETDKPAECFCTQDFSTWICKTCFDDFKEKFNFKLLDKT